MEGEDAEGAADLGTAEGGRFGFAEGAKLTGATLDDVAVNVAREGGSARSGSRRVGKNVKVSERKTLDEGESGGVIGFGFARKAGDDVSADGGVRKLLANELEAASVMFSAIPAMHGGEDAVRAGLQGHVEVLGEAMGGGEERDEVASDVERLDGTDTETLDGSFVEDFLQKIEEMRSRGEIAAPGAEIDAAQHDFAEARGSEAVQLSDDGTGREAAAFAANKGNHAERAAGVATILDFQSGASVMGFPAENRSDEDIRNLENVACEDWRKLGRSIPSDAERSSPLTRERRVGKG
jgi:hypothetical protein